MDEALKRKLTNLIQEEQKSEVDPQFLTRLHELASGPPLYEKFAATEMNALNQFFRELRNYLFEQVLAGDFGAQVIIDAVIVLSFEVGYKLREGEPSPPP
jgi:hypothetical protein